MLVFSLLFTVYNTKKRFLNNIKISRKLSSVIGVFICLSGKDVNMCEALCISVYYIQTESLQGVLYDMIYIRTVYTYTLMAILL